MNENVKVRWLVDHEQTKVAPKTLSSQVYNEDGTLYKDTVAASIEALNETVATKEYVESLYKKLNSNTTLGFYCVEDVAIVTNGISKTYPANSNVEIKFIEDDVFEIITTSDNSILALSAFPGALGTYYSWLEGVKQFSNILFDMNNEAMYSKWSQGNQGTYQVQFAQYTNCIFWSDNPYISEVAKRTNYTLCSTSQLPLCYSTIPDNTFKSFYLAFSVNSDPNWSNPVYKDSFAKATWVTQAFSYYGARTVGFPGHDSPNFTITLPKDCRGLMFDARNIECAGTFDAVNTTNFGAQSGSWREAFGDCTSLRRLYIKNLKVNLNISWSPIDYYSIYYIVSKAANTNAITISVSPYTYNLLDSSDFELAASKNITIALLTTNYVEDKRLSAITLEGDGSKVLSDDGTYRTLKISQLENDSNFVTDVDDSLSATSTNPVQNKIITEKIDSLNVLVGDTAVSEQISEAINSLEIPEGFSGSWIDLTDKPFGEVEGKDYLVEEASIVLGEAMAGTETYVPTVRPFSGFVEGKTYCVVFDGEVYPVEYDPDLDALNVEAIDIEVYYGGNDEMTVCTVYSDPRNGETHTFGLYETQLVTAQLDEKYIPDTIARVSAIDEHNISETAHNDIRTKVNDLQGLVGDVAVSEQIITATDTKMDKTNPVGTGSLSMNRKPGSNEGVSSTTLGYNGSASGIYALAEGAFTSASGYASHAEGYNTNATRHSQHVEGQYNILDTEGTTKGKYVHIVGNGTALDKRSNAHTLDWNGLGWFAGGIKVGGTGQDDEAAKELATKEYVDAAKPKWTSLTLSAANWIGDENPWSQVVTVNGVTVNSKVDLQPSAVQIVEMQDNDIALMAENDDGVITVYAIGSKPTVDYTMQALITEVAVI